MKVLHLWRSDSSQYGGGGAASMYRIHSNLIEHDIESSILCEQKATSDPNVYLLPPLNRTEKRIKRITAKIGLNDIHRTSSFKITQDPVYVDADIIHFHGIHSGFINYLALPKLTRNKPAVFTLRDMWSMTGHCAQSFDCDRWKIGCGKCTYPLSYPPIQRDMTHIEWRLKKWVYSRSNLTIIALSKSFVDAAKQSILKHFPIHHIPNGIDIEMYRPLSKKESRYSLGIPQDKKVILFGSVDLNSYAKGCDLVVQVAQNLPESLKANTCILLFGNYGEELAKQIDIPCIDLGFVSDQQVKAAAYSAADLLLFPSRAEAFANMPLESMACGTPVVAFPVGGCSDVVRPGKTGFLANMESGDELLKAVCQLLENDDVRETMAEECRSCIVNEYSTELETQRHIDLYSSLI